MPRVFTVTAFVDRSQCVHSYVTFVAPLYVDYPYFVFPAAFSASPHMLTQTHSNDSLYRASFSRRSYLGSGVSIAHGMV